MNDTLSRQQISRTNNLDSNLKQSQMANQLSY